MRAIYMAPDRVLEYILSLSQCEHTGDVEGILYEMLKELDVWLPDSSSGLDLSERLHMLNIDPHFYANKEVGE